MRLIPSLMRKVVRDRVHPSTLQPSNPPPVLDWWGGGQTACGTERERDACDQHGFDLDDAYRRPGSWLDFKCLGSGLFPANLPVALCFSIQLQAESFSPWQRQMLGSLICEPSRKSELWHAVENRQGENNSPSVRCLVPYPLWILAKEKRKNSNK